MNNFTDWSYTVAAQTDLLPDRGFTGHEYLPWFKLYNMNGRLYDPVVGRFLEPDPVVQDASSTQNLNRYSYCLNNPLKYTDPSGYRKRRLEPGPGEERWISEDAARIMGGFGLPGGYAQYRNNLSNYSYNLFNNYQAGQANSITDVTYPFYNVNRNYRSIYGDGCVRIPIYKHTAAYVEMDGIYYFKGYGYTFAGYQESNEQGNYKDVTAAFDSQLDKTMAFFSVSSDLFDINYSENGLMKKIDKLLFFRSKVNDKAIFDIKRSAFSISNLGAEFGFYRGAKFYYDDFGNYNYGLAAKYFGFTLETALLGAGINQIGKGNPDLGNPGGYFDHSRDSEMIRMGYNHKW